MVMRRYTYKSTQSKNGEFRATIGAELNEKIDVYCKIKHINKSVYISQCVERCLDDDMTKLKREQFSIYTKEELIDMLLREMGEVENPWIVQE